MTKAPLFLFLVFIFLLLQNFNALTQAQSTTAPAPQNIGVKTSEVLLDVLVHDKKGRIIRDIKPEEIEVFEDGIKQPINSFRFIEADNKKAVVEASSSNTSQQLNLVTLVFDHQDAQRFQTARQAAITFLDTALKPDTLVRVFVIGRKLYLMEQFTNDRSKIAKAIERGLGTSEKSFAEVSERNMQEITALAEKMTDPVKADVETNPDHLLLRMTLNTIQQANKILGEVGAPSPVFHLLSIARNHHQIAGRKMVFYISDGLYLQNASLSEILRNVVSAANQANLTFYAINTRQTLASTGGVNSRLETSTVVNATQSPGTGTVGARDPFDSFQGRHAGGTATFEARSAFTRTEVIGRNKELNKKGPLNELTESTGGEVIQNINDITTAVKQAVNELGIYYALAYSPTKQELDGKFRQITVKLSRPGLKPVTRNGYFAVPASTSKPTLTFETPMLAALNNTVVPHDFDYRAITLQFEQRQNERHEVLMVEAPLSALLRNEDKAKKVWPLGFAMMAVVKNAKDEIVQKFSDSYQLEIPTAQIEDAKKSSAYLVRHFWLPPGGYTLETVIHDQAGNRLSANRRPFTVANTSAGLKTGSLYLVKRIDPVNEDELEAENPLFVNKFKVTPELADNIAAQEREDIPFHFSIYPDAALPAPKLRIELLLDGKVIATTTPTLPKADEKGVITFSAGIPTKGLATGNYRVHTVVQQADAIAEESIAFKVSGTVAKKEDPDDGVKAIASALAAPTDRVSELALVATKTAKPIELAPASLIEETEKNGALLSQRLGDYTYSLRKVRRTFDKKGRLRAEEFKDYEAYPVKGQHALVQMSTNGSRATVDRVELDRKQATEALIKNEEEKQKAAINTAKQQASYWGAGIDGFVQGKQIYLSINPAHFFRACEFSAPRLVTLDGRETIVLDYRPRPDAQLSVEKDWVQKMAGSIWIDAADKVLIRIEGLAQTNSISATQRMPNLVYQQQRISEGLWAPALIRLTSDGDASLFRGLNNDVWFEFSNFKRFDSADSDLKLQTPQEKKGNL
ncbi:MAG: VWA domain-containing protein [Acidobacteria bacterium]|nr:VWA domain-containing protein [Acidobacteriota bacterium]MBS1811039.1 VWA domain-containing protein [Acidobacteriota bacterium]